MFLFSESLSDLLVVADWLILFAPVVGGGMGDWYFEPLCSLLFCLLASEPEDRPALVQGSKAMLLEEEHLAVLLTDLLPSSEKERKVVARPLLEAAEEWVWLSRLLSIQSSRTGVQPITKLAIELGIAVETVETHLQTISEAAAVCLLWMLVLD